MRETWRFVNSGTLPGAHNMALDEAILRAHQAGAVPPTLRVYGWKPEAVSLGKFQRLESTVDPEACRRLGLDIVRRPTGGRALLHTAEEVTFSLVVSAARLGTRGVMDSYRRLAEGIIAGLRTLGLDARLLERASLAPPGPAGLADPACFARTARCDLVVGTAKLVGSAQVQQRGFLLQQNSLPLRLHADRWAHVFLRPATPPHARGLWEAIGRAVPVAEVAAALRGGFADAFGVNFQESGLSPQEQDAASGIGLPAPPGVNPIPEA